MSIGQNSLFQYQQQLILLPQNKIKSILKQENSSFLYYMQVLKDKTILMEII